MQRRNNRHSKVQLGRRSLCRWWNFRSASLPTNKKKKKNLLYLYLYGIIEFVPSGHLIDGWLVARYMCLITALEVSSEWFQRWRRNVFELVPVTYCSWKERVFIHFCTTIGYHKTSVMEILVSFHDIFCFTVFECFWFNFCFVNNWCKVVRWWYSRLETVLSQLFFDAAYVSSVMQKLILKAWSEDLLMFSKIISWIIYSILCLLE